MRSQNAMTMSKTICLSKYDNSGFSGALYRLNKKTVAIDCLALLSYTKEQKLALYKECDNALVVLSMDLHSIAPRVFELPDFVTDQGKEPIGQLFHELTFILANSYSIALPYYEEEHPHAAPFQLSRALLRHFLRRGFHLDDQEIFKKHRHSLHRTLQTPSTFKEKPSSKPMFHQRIALNVVDKRQDYFSNPVEALVCLRDYLEDIDQHNSSPVLYLGFKAGAFPFEGDLAALIKELPNLPNYRYNSRPEWVLILRDDKYSFAAARDAAHQEIKLALYSMPAFGHLHVFLLTKDQDEPLSKAYPDYSKSAQPATWIPLVNNAGYYLTDHKLFQNALKANCRKETVGKTVTQYLTPEESKPFFAPAPEIKNTELDPEEEDFTEQKTSSTPTISYVMRSQVQTEAKQVQQAKQQAQVAETLDQQQLTTLQEQQQESLNKTGQSLFGMGVFNRGFNSFVQELTMQLTNHVAERRAERKTFKLYFANPESTNDLWGLGEPSDAAIQITSKLFGVGILEQKDGHELIKTQASLKYIDWRYFTAQEIVRHIEHYLDGYSFLNAINGRKSLHFQAPMRVKENNELVVTEEIHNNSTIPYSVDFEPDLPFTFQASDLLSTLPLATDSREAREAYYRTFNGQIFAAHESAYFDRLMAVFWNESPSISKQEQEACINDYCKLYRECDSSRNSEKGEQIIRSLLKESKNFKADLKRLLYVHIKGGQPFVHAMTDLLIKLEDMGLWDLFYKITFEKSDYIFSLFALLRSKEPIKMDTSLDATEKLFFRMPAKKQWLPYHHFLASYLLSFPQVLSSTCSSKPTDFWAQIEGLVQSFAKGPLDNQEKTLGLIATNLAGEYGLRIRGGCHPEIVFRALTKILSSAGSHWTFFEQVEMLSDLPMAWCDALHAIEKEGFRVVCREMKLETAYLNPVKAGLKHSNGYKVSRADFEKALNNPPRSEMPISLETLLFRYLGCEISRHNLGYYRLLFKKLENCKNNLLRERAIGWFVFYGSGPYYSQQGTVRNLDIEKHFSDAEKPELRLLLKQLQEVPISETNHDNPIHERYQLKSLLERVPHPAYEGLPPLIHQSLNLAIDKRHLSAFLQSQQQALETSGVDFWWINTAFIDEALEEEPFFTNSIFQEKQKRLLKALLPGLNQDNQGNWASNRASLQALVKDMAVFLRFFTEAPAYKPEQGEALYQGLSEHSADKESFEAVLAVLLECQHDTRIDFSHLLLFFDAISLSPKLKKNQAVLARMAALVLKSNPPPIEEIRLCAALGEHLLSSPQGIDMQLFNAIVTIRESTDAQAWLSLCCELSPSLSSQAVALFGLVNHHENTLPFLKKITDTGQIASLEEWLISLKLASPNQRLFIFEIIDALMQKEAPMDWISWIQTLKDLPLAELSALAKLSKQAQFSTADIRQFASSHTAIITMNIQERATLKPVPAALFADAPHTLEKINELRYKPSSGHSALGLEHHERKALWEDYLTLQSLVTDQSQKLFIEELSNGSRSTRSLAELTEAEIQTLVLRIRAEWADPSTPSFRRHDLELMLIALASIAIYRVTRRFPRDVQLLAVLNSMNRPGHVIHEIATGEGKGITTALHAILVWGRGHSADVATINDKLAERDRKQFNPVYQFLGIPCSPEIIAPDTAPEACKKQGIYYGIWSSFSLLKTNMATKGLLRPQPRSLICDEVDATINTTVEARLATTIDPGFHGKEKWELLYNYLLDFVSNGQPPLNRVNCRNYLAAREQAERLKNPNLPELPKLGDALLKELLRATKTAHSYQDKVHYSIVEKTVIEDKKAKTYLYAAPILDSTKSPEATISWHWVQQLLHTKLNRTPHLPFPFEIETHAETVVTVSASDFFNDYQKSGGWVYALTGTAGSSPDVKRFFEQNKCVSFEHPRFAKNRRKDHGIEGAWGEEAHFALLLEKLQFYSGQYHKPDKGSPPFLSVFSTAKEVEAFYHYVQGKDPAFATRLQCYDGVDRPGRLSIENCIARAGQANTITLTTESLARGADIDASHPKGLFTFNCCTNLTDSELLQILGRAARAGNKGHCISILDLSRLIPQGPGETVDVWFARHRTLFAEKQSNTRERRRPLQEIRYAVASRILDLKVALASILSVQEGLFSSSDSDTKFLKALNELDQNIETEYYQLLGQKDPCIEEKMIAYAVAQYEKSLIAVLEGYQLDDYQTLELPMPLEAIPGLKALNEAPIRDLGFISDTLSKLWELAGNKKAYKCFEIADQGMLHLDTYFKKQTSLQALLLGQCFNLGFISKEEVIKKIDTAQTELNGWLLSVTDLKILGHSMFFNKEEALEIEIWVRQYLDHIKDCITYNKWDEIKPPHSEDKTVTKYIERLKGLMPSGKGGKGNKLVRFAMKRILKPLITKQSLVPEEREKQLAMLNTAEAVLSSIEGAFKNNYSLDTPLKLWLEAFQTLFKQHQEQKDQSDEQSDVVNGLLRALEQRGDSLQNAATGYVIQALPAALALINRNYAELSLRAFLKPEVLFSFITELIKLPSFLKIFEDKPRILAMMHRLREVPFSSFEKLAQLTLADNQLLDFLKIMANPHFSSFLAELPKDAHWGTMATWLSSPAAATEPIQKAINTLQAYEKDRIQSMAVSKEKLRTVRDNFRLSSAALAEELKILHTPPPVPETRNEEPLEANPNQQARIIAAAIKGITPKAEQSSPTPNFPEPKAWTKRGQAPAAFLTEAMTHINQSGEARPMITECIKQIGKIINHKKIPAAQRFHAVENMASAIKQWQLLDAQNPNKATNYVQLLKPALISCMKGYRRGFGKNRDRYKLIRQLQTKAQSLKTSEALLDSLLSIKQQLLEQDRRADESYLHVLLGWHRNTKGRSRLLDHLDIMIVGTTAVMMAEGKAATAENRIALANKDMLRSFIQRKITSVSMQEQMKALISKDPKTSYHPPLVEAQHHLKKAPIFSQRKNLNAFFVSFDRVESFRQDMRYTIRSTSS